MAAFPASAVSSGAYRHDGFYLQLALGLGTHIFFEKVQSAPVEATQNITGSVIDGQVMLGGTVLPGLVVGGGLQFMIIPRGKKGIVDLTFATPVCSPTPGSLSGTTCSSGQRIEGETDRSASLFVLGPFVDYHPSPTGGLHFQGSLGYASFSYSDKGTNQGNGFSGPGVTLGAGYELWVAEQWSLGLMGQIHIVSLNADDRPSGIDKDSGGLMSLSALVTASYH